MFRRSDERLLGEVAGLLGVAHDESKPPDKPRLMGSEGCVE